ncbi:patatin-like phospholipase family protein [Oceanobacter kriegii]|uniref:patatin-like phospholipase family protein n=1 Tax=Oceanobacter kriegii TaxID=64972 RepID=UPI0003FD1E3B|nr:patatin-like phospholipase family protein [Oceanobacter kriegii]
MALLKRKRKPISLALQGGGSHGAFTWGVLDRLLQEPGLRLNGVSGTSAGAMNAVALAQGLMENGNEGARLQLETFWNAVAASAPFKMTSTSASGDVSMSPTVGWMMGLTQYFSPYQLNPLDINPLRDIVESQFDFKALKKNSPVNLFIAATNANTGRLKLFRNNDLCSEALLASACLPTVHHTIQIKGQPYWDGGYSANPAVFPLYQHCDASDILMILLAPMVHGEMPTSVDEIKARAVDISFNAGFLREMRIIAQTRAMCGGGRFKLFGQLEHTMRRLNFHLIDPDGELEKLPSATRVTPDAELLNTLKEMGQRQADRWLKKHHQSLGKRSTVDLAKTFM